MHPRTSATARRTRLVLSALLLALVVGAASAPSDAAGFAVTAGSTRVANGVIRLDARIDYELSPASLEALANGVPLTMVLDIEVVRIRAWLWDERIASVQRRYRLEYHALARQYLVHDLGGDKLRSFPDLYDALDHLGEVRDLPVLDVDLMEDPGPHRVRMRVSLDIEALPAPMRPLAYLSGEWRLDSGWYTWPI